MMMPTSGSDFVEVAGTSGAAEDRAAFDLEAVFVITLVQTALHLSREIGSGHSTVFLSVFQPRRWSVGFSASDSVVTGPRDTANR